MSEGPGRLRFAARVVADFGRRFVVASVDGAPPVGAVRRGKLDDVVVGDGVECSPSGDAAVIETVAPRRRLLYRSVASRTKLLAANVDQVAIVFAAQPAFDPHFIYRALIAAAAADVDALVIRNKSDLPDAGGRVAAMLAELERQRVPTLAVAVRAAPEPSREQLLAAFAGRATLLVGQSGMGKSSIVNLMVPGARERTGEFSARLNLGRQTTTASRWFDLPAGGALIDAPGFQRFGLGHVEARGLAALMPDYGPLAADCRFSDCLHLEEPGCAVRAAVDGGAISPERHAFYRDLAAELRR